MPLQKSSAPEGCCDASRPPAGRGSRRSRPLLSQTHDWAVDDEPGRRERTAVGRRDVTLLGQVLNRAVVGLPDVLTGGDDLIAPPGQVDVPHRAVAALRRIPAHNLQWIEPVENGRIDSLSLWV